MNAYVLDSSSGKTVLVIESDEPYYILRVVKKLQTMRERDLKLLFKSIEEYMNANN
jgi:hypothetical protein